MPDQPQRPDAFRFTRRHALAAAALTTAAAASSSVARLGSSAQETAGRSSLQAGLASPVASPVADLDDALLAEVVAELASAGVAVYESPGAVAPIVAVEEPGPVSILITQLRPMVREAMLGGGVLGADLDALVTDRELAGSEDATEFTLDDELPQIDGNSFFPPSLLVASYIEVGDSPGAALVRRFRPDVTIDGAAAQQIPSLGMILFAAEVAREYAGPAEFTPFGIHALVPMGIQGGICSQIQGFIDNTINMLFSALTVDLGPSPLGQILGGIINGIIQKARIPLKAAIDAITKPVLDIIRDVAGVLGTAAMVVSAIRPWTLKLTATPTATRLAVGAEPGLPGDVAAMVDLGGLDEWPADVSDCAATSGVPLPPLKPANARCSWIVTGSRPNLVFTDELPPALDKDARATMKYHTLSEDEETAKGKPVTGLVLVTASVARPEVDDLKKTISNLLFAQLPAIVNQFVRPYLGPVVDQLLGKIASLTDSRTSITIPVLYHEPPDPTPTPSVEPEPSDEAGASIDFTIEPIEQVFPVTIGVSAATCDGEAWDGEVALSFHPDFSVAWSNIEGTAPISWDFAGEDQATGTSDPIDGTLEIWNGNTMAIRYIFDFTVTRIRNDDEETESLSFALVLHATLDGTTETNPITGGTNLGVPIPVTPGGAVCSS